MTRNLYRPQKDLSEKVFGSIRFIIKIRYLSNFKISYY